MDDWGGGGRERAAAPGVAWARAARSEGLALAEGAAAAAGRGCRLAAVVRAAVGQVRR